jgi:hypothetical protein
MTAADGAEAADLRARIAAHREDRLRASGSPRRGAARPPAGADRAARLAAWFDARLEVCDNGTAIIVERSVPLGEEDAASLAALPPAAYLDTETTGLSTGAGTVPFLAGLGIVSGDTLVVRQLVLPDYPDERALLRRLVAELGARDRIVTYNGRGFDMPLLASRLTVHGLFAEQATLPERHDDLLPIARRLWRRVLGGARLAEIESAVLGVRRTSDCPGSEAPLRYFSYLRDGSPQPLAAVLDHNLQDIASLARLEAHIARLRSGGWRTAWPLDHRGMAVDRARDGDAEAAMAIVQHALASADRREAHELRRIAARMLLAAHDIPAAEALWHTGTCGGSVDAAIAWIEVARIRERYRGDLHGALEAVTAAVRTLDLAFALGRGGSLPEIGRARLVADRRLRRLRSWVTARERTATRSRGAHRRLRGRGPDAPSARLPGSAA